MNTIHLTDEELEMARQALQAYLLAFGHDEADTHQAIRRVLAKLRAAEPEGEAHRVAGGSRSPRGQAETGPCLEVYEE